MNRRCYVHYTGIFAVSMNHGILTLCRYLIIHSYTAQATPCDVKHVAMALTVASDVQACYNDGLADQTLKTGVA